LRLAEEGLQVDLHVLRDVDVPGQERAGGGDVVIQKQSPVGRVHVGLERRVLPDRERGLWGTRGVTQRFLALAKYIRTDILLA
jgi:hypothetical protein